MCWMNLFKLIKELNGCESKILNIKYMCIIYKVLYKWFLLYLNFFFFEEKKVFGKYGEVKVEFGVIVNMFFVMFKVFYRF